MKGISALIILDESDRMIEVPLIYGNDPKALFYCFPVFTRN